MWDAHPCDTEVARARPIAARINATAAALRRRGALIVHAPFTYDRLKAYGCHCARARAAALPHAPMPPRADPARHPYHRVPFSDPLDPLRLNASRPGGGGCDGRRDEKVTWARQTAAIDIDP
eukprot:gene47353-65568_t